MTDKPKPAFEQINKIRKKYASAWFQAGYSTARYGKYDESHIDKLTVKFVKALIAYGGE